MAVPAMSRCAQGAPLFTKRCRNCAAVIEPASRPPIFFISASFESISLLYFLDSGSRHTVSPVSSPASVIWEAKRVVIGEQPRIFLAERNHYRARERCKRNHELRLKMLLRVPEKIRKHEPPFGISIEDFNGLAGCSSYNIARPACRAAWHVLHEADKADGADRRLAAGERSHDPGDSGCSGHVALHVFHALAGLMRNAARIEADALPYEDEISLGPVDLGDAVPPQNNRGGRLRAALAHGKHRIHAQRFQARARPRPRPSVPPPSARGAVPQTLAASGCSLARSPGRARSRRLRSESFVFLNPARELLPGMRKDRSDAAELRSFSASAFFGCRP